MHPDIRTPESLTQDAHAHARAVASDLGPLSAELKAALPHASTREKGLLEFDLSNLVSGLRELISLRQAGVNTEDLDAAEQDIGLLSLGLRRSCVRILSERAKAVRLHTDVALTRKDKDIDPLDVTEAFRILFARPASRKNGGVRIHDFGLPEAGGPIGSVSGKCATIRVHETHDVSGVAPEDTIYLPKGHVIYLDEGESILLHTAGLSKGDEPLDIRGFNPNTASCGIIALEDGVCVTGPATLSSLEEGAKASKRWGLYEYKRDEFFARLSALEALPKVHAEIRDLPVYRTEKGMSFAGFSSIAALALSIPVFIVSTSSSVMFWAAALPYASVVTSLFGYGAFMLFKPKVSQGLADLTQGRRTTFRTQNDLQEEIEDLESHFSITHRVEFYPERKVVCLGSEGPKVVHPHLRLPSAINDGVPASSETHKVQA